MDDFIAGFYFNKPSQAFQLIQVKFDILNKIDLAFFCTTTFTPMALVSMYFGWPAASGTSLPTEKSDCLGPADPVADTRWDYFHIAFHAALKRPLLLLK